MEWVQVIAQVGFPIAVAAYLLTKLETKLESCETAARDLAVKLELHTERCNKCREARPCRYCDVNTWKGEVDK